MTTTRRLISTAALALGLLGAVAAPASATTVKHPAVARCFGHGAHKCPVRCYGHGTHKCPVKAPAHKVVKPAPKAAPAAVTGANDYPWVGQTGFDPYGFEMGTCGSYVAWQVRGRGFTYADTLGGNAASVLTQAPAFGATVTAAPAVGGIAVWTAGEDYTETSGAGVATVTGHAGDGGHVAIIDAVGPTGDLLVSEYNATAYLAFSQVWVSAPGNYLTF
jgi:surface antigen